MYIRKYLIYALSATTITGCAVGGVSPNQSQIASTAPYHDLIPQQNDVYQSTPYVDGNGQVRYYYVSTNSEMARATADRFSEVSSAQAHSRAYTRNTQSLAQRARPNTIAASYNVQSPEPVNRRHILKTIPHSISAGETVYSLARQGCHSVETIRLINGLDSSYAINVGNRLNLPASRC